MLLNFFQILRDHDLPVSTREMLDCLQLFEAGLLHFDMEQFYFLSRTSLVKNERLYDKFDQAFSAFLSGIELERQSSVFEEEQPAIWLREVLAQSHLQPEEISRSLSDYEAAIKEMNEGNLKSELADSGEAADSGNGSEPGNGSDENQGEDGEEGEDGDSGEEGETGDEGEKGERGERGEGEDGQIGEGESDDGIEGSKQTFEKAPRQRAEQLWAMRRFAELDDQVELGTRNLKVALRRVRKLARTGADLELDLDTTIRNTAKQGGLLDIVEVPERHNSVKVLLFFDVGGSMDEYVELCEQLFSAAKYEFKYLRYFYFHNFLYEKVWTDVERLDQHRVPTWDLIHRFSKDYKVIFVGDADMARHEILEKGGSVEHYNAEPGQVWFERVCQHFRHVVWLNPSRQEDWWNSESTQLVKRLLENEMYPLNVAGIDLAARSLTK